MAMVVPVAGVRLNQIRNDFGARRGGGRSHKGQDIFAPTGTPVLAAVGGTVARSGWNNMGGNRVWVQGDDGRAYYYSHLHSLGAKQGQRVTAGQQIGTVGATGNARGTPPHLHFSINRRVGPENPVGPPLAIMQRAGAQTLARPGSPSPAGEHSAGQGGAAGDVAAQMRQSEAARAQQERARQLQARTQQIEERELQASQEHQNRMLNFIGMTLRQQQGRGEPMPVRSAVRVDESQFSPAGHAQRLQRLQGRDLTPLVARRPVQDRQMLDGMGRHIRQLGR